MIRYLLTFLNILFITGTSYYLVDGFYNFATMQIGQTQSAKQISTGFAEQHSAKVLPLSYYDSITSRNLFHLQVATLVKDKASQVDLAALKQTELNLKLWGTVFGKGNTNYAVIEVKKTRKQNLYKKGDSLEDAVVKMILREKVILEVNGKDEVLTMEKVETGRSATKTRGRTANFSRPGAKRSQKINLKRSLIEDSIKDISKLMTQIKIRPHMENGEASGLKLSSIKPNSIFRRMGLRNGDVLMGVDGENIQTVDDALKLYENLKTSSSVQVDVKRRGSIRTINYMIQ